MDGWKKQNMLAKEVTTHMLVQIATVIHEQ